MINGSNDAFSPKKVLFWVSLEKFEGTESKTPENRQKEDVVYGFLAKLEKYQNTHISVR
jgi:hypothetical protein